MTLPEVALLFLRLGVVSFGGGPSVLAELQRELVDRYGAMSQQQFLNAWALGQATPGPGILFLVPLGFYTAGVPGAVVATVSFLIPPLVLQIVVASQWERLSRSPWIRALDRTLGPISVGLIGVSFFSLGQPLLGVPVQALGVLVATVVALVFRPTPAVIALGAGLLGVLGVF